MPSHGYLAYTQGKGVQGGCKPPAFFNADDSDDSDNSDNSDPAPPGCAVASSTHCKGTNRNLKCGERRERMEGYSPSEAQGNERKRSAKPTAVNEAGPAYEVRFAVTQTV